MVSVSIEDKPGFRIIGTKIWIPGPDNDLFGAFWKKCHADGTVEQISKFSLEKDASVTGSEMIGLSCTERDPSVRSFYFYIAVETMEIGDQRGYEVLSINPYRWAIFSSEGNDIDALMECEMYAWREWLPNNGTYVHDNGPEMEVYSQENGIEYWVPIRDDGNG